MIYKTNGLQQPSSTSSLQTVSQCGTTRRSKKLLKENQSQIRIMKGLALLLVVLAVLVVDAYEDDPYEDKMMAEDQELETRACKAWHSECNSASECCKKKPGAPQGQQYEMKCLKPCTPEKCSAKGQCLPTRRS
ncbi:uncharacterized protein LOC116289871 [Actinia tenebrosa]|uniref:Uncharacterized protein LOC116289871 n=1 Tax=Actinia tenebrosa TaxID=6105 RepID=A0A6P8H8A1_ACTTE|nr:uncharacterized protein LOC116289871 [Actinia tenebrosa]